MDYWSFVVALADVRRSIVQWQPEEGHAFVTRSVGGFLNFHVLFVMTLPAIPIIHDFHPSLSSHESF